VSQYQIVHIADYKGGDVGERLRNVDNCNTVVSGSEKEFLPTQGGDLRHEGRGVVYDEVVVPLRK